MITGSAAPSLPSFLPFYFRLRAFSIQRARLSRSLEQAMLNSIALTQWLTWFSLHYHTLIGSGLLCSHLVVAIHSCRPLSARMVFLMVNIPWFTSVLPAGKSISTSPVYYSLLSLFTDPLFSLKRLSSARMKIKTAGALFTAIAKEERSFSSVTSHVLSKCRKKKNVDKQASPKKVNTRDYH